MFEHLKWEIILEKSINFYCIYRILNFIVQLVLNNIWIFNLDFEQIEKLSWPHNTYIYIFYATKCINFLDGEDRKWKT